MSAVGVSRAGYRPTGTASAAAAAGDASSKTGDGAGTGAAGASTATAVSVAEKEAERTVDVRAILKKKEDEVKEMLAPEKEMYGEWLVGMEDELNNPLVGSFLALLCAVSCRFCLFCVCRMGERRCRSVPL